MQKGEPLRHVSFSLFYGLTHYAFIFACYSVPYALQSCLACFEVNLIFSNNTQNFFCTQARNLISYYTEA